jgi:hypothetical protein
MARAGFPHESRNDKYNNEVNPSLTMDERTAELGCNWHVELPRVAIAGAATNSLSFTTPAATVGDCFLNHVCVSKDGAVLDIQFMEGDTPAAGSAATMRNLNRAITNPDSNCPFTNVKTACTTSGGTQIWADMLAGAAFAIRQSSDAMVDSWVKLKPATHYTLLLTATGAITWAFASMDLVCLVAQ